MSEFENLIKSPANRQASYTLNPESSTAPVHLTDARMLMSEEQELKLIVKNCAKKLTYEEEEEKVGGPSQFTISESSSAVNNNNFDIVLSDGGDSDPSRDDPMAEDDLTITENDHSNNP